MKSDEGDSRSPEPATTHAQGLGGADETFGFFPYVGVVSGNNTCTGTLITPARVLTASHCFNGANNSCGLIATPGELQNGVINVFFGSELGTPPQVTSSPSVAGTSQFVAPSSEPTNLCSTASVARDFAIVALDRPIYTIEAIHPPTSEACRNEFEGTLVGYGSRASTWPGPELFGSDLDDRGRRNRSDWDFLSQGGFGAYRSRQSAAAALAGQYNGPLGGDSGGPLFRFAGGTPVLCGVISGNRPGYAIRFTGPFGIIPVAEPVVDTMVAAADARRARELINDAIRDVDGRYFGECLPGEVEDEALTKVDTDGDVIPDGCDPCPTIPDPEYRRTGEFSLPDTDGDGIPNACDNCPGDENASQIDSDGDGVGDACDTCEEPDPPNRLPCCESDNDCAGQFQFQSCVDVSASSNIHNCEVGVCSKIPDRDSDGRGDVCDNCPGTDNVDQLDTDGDFSGDACDLCPGVHSYSGTPDGQLNPLDVSSIICPFAADEDTDDQFCVQVTGNERSHCARGPAGDQNGRCTYADRDGDGDGQGDSCDGCPNDADGSSDLPQNNCNLEAEIANRRPYPLPGDACDLSPCPRQEGGDLGAPVNQGEIPWLNLSYRAYTLPEAHPNAFPYSVPRGGQLPTGQQPESTVGFRACSCQRGNLEACRRRPNDPCIVTTNLYDSSTQWTPMNVVRSATREAPAFPPTSGFAPNGEVPGALTFSPNRDPAYADTSLPLPTQLNSETERLHITWTLNNVPLMPLSLPDGEFGTTGYGFEGVVWNHIPNVDGIQPSNEPVYRVWSSHARYVQAGTLPEPLPDPSEVAAPVWRCGLMCKFTCKRCDLFTRFDPGVYVNPVDRYIGIGTDQFQEPVTTLLPRPFADALLSTENVRLRAAEPPGSLMNGAPGFASIDRAGTGIEVFAGVFNGELYAVDGQFGDDDGGVIIGRAAAARAATATADGPKALTEFYPVLSGSERTVFLLGTKAQSGERRSLERIAVFGGQRQEMELNGPQLGKVLAATYRESDRSLYAVDEVRVGYWWRKARLIRIDLNARQVHVLGKWPRFGWFDHLELAVGEDDTIMLAASSSRGRSFVVAGLNIDGNDVYLRWLEHGSGSLAHAPSLTDEGLTLAITRDGSTRYALREYGELRRGWGHLGSCVR